MRRPIIWILCALAIGVVLWIGFTADVLVWDGGVGKSLKITVTEASTNKPVAGATVIFLRPDDLAMFREIPDSERQSWIENLNRNSKSVGPTAADGSVTLRVSLPAGGTETRFRTYGSYGITGTLLVMVGGAIRHSEELTQLIPELRRTLNDELPPVRITPSPPYSFSRVTAQNWNGLATGLFPSGHWAKRFKGK